MFTDELSQKLDEYRAFRHFFVHGYGIMLDEDKLLPLTENLPEVWKQFEAKVDEFVESLKGN